MQYATYCPEDNKLRLYVGRVPRDEYETLRAQGWTSTPKQDCDFVAVWTPQREDTALEYSPDGIEDEDQSPADRAADRAERFGAYADKRAGEAEGHADRFDATPLLHGHQSAVLAERRAAAHDRIATRAVNQWEKAEYWHFRTAGVIAHALHVSTPGVRMGRIKELEAEIRGAEKSRADYAAHYARWSECAALTDVEARDKRAVELADCDYVNHDYKHPRPETVLNAYISEHGSSLYSLMNMVKNGYGSSDISGTEACTLWLACHAEPKEESRWLRHLRLRLAYEMQMLEAQGGRAAFVEMEPGGWIGTQQILKVNKSPATGRVVSVGLKAPHITGWVYGTKNVKGKDYAIMTLEVERLKADVYRAPTDEERAAFANAKKAEKKAAAEAKKAGPPEPKLCNPTNEDAERLQAVWNAQAVKNHDYDCNTPGAVIYTTQEVYSRNLKAGSAKTYDITGGGDKSDESWNRADFPTVAKVRGSRKSVIVLTDKPQKPFPAVVWEDPRPAARAEVVSRIVELAEAVTAVFAGVGHYKDNLSREHRQLFGRAMLVGLAQSQSHSQTQWGLTDEGWRLAREAGFRIAAKEG